MSPKGIGSSFILHPSSSRRPTHPSRDLSSLEVIGMSYRVVCAAVVGLLLAGAARAQTLQQGLEALEKKNREQGALIRQLLKGEVPANPMDKQHVDAVDTAARYV